MHRSRKLYIIVAFYIIGSFLSAQSTPYAEAFERYLQNQPLKAQKLLRDADKTERNKLLQWHIAKDINGITDSIINEELSDDPTLKVLQLLKNAEIYRFYYFEKDSLIFQNLKLALNLAKTENNHQLIRMSYSRLLEQLFENRVLQDVLIDSAEDFHEYISNATDYSTYMYYKYTAQAFLNKEETIAYYQKALDSLKHSEDDFSKGVMNQIIGIQHQYFNKATDSAIFYLKKAADYYEKIPTYKAKKTLYKINNNLGITYNRVGQSERALTYFRKSALVDLGDADLKGKAYSYQALGEIHEKLKNFDSAYYYALLEKNTLNQFNEYENAIQQREIETKYQTAEKEKQILIEQQKKKRNAAISFGLAGILVFGGITFALVQKNTKKKQLLAERENELQLQKVNGLMKEMELNAIDAMIEGQEKERQRIAGDLHNNIGNVMTTLQLQFQALEENPSDDLFKKTSKLIQETYTKIRHLSHEKNASVFASQGLLKSLNNLATAINETKKIQLEIHEHGMDEPLPNSLELTIFRIIQELITNILKHANASEAYIHLTNHGESLSIVVEDNGIGFDPKTIKKENGMGVHSMYKTIENLEGKMTIDSAVDNGTSVLIDIPL